MEQPTLQGWLKRLVDSFARWLGGSPKRQKTFRIHAPGSTPLSLDRQPRRAGASGFRVEAATRPQVCPVCRTPGGKIARTESLRFQCRKCDYEWS